MFLMMFTKEQLWLDGFGTGLSLSNLGSVPSGNVWISRDVTKGVHHDFYSAPENSNYMWARRILYKKQVHNLRSPHYWYVLWQ